MSNRSTPTVSPTSSFSKSRSPTSNTSTSTSSNSRSPIARSLSSSRQRAYLDEKRRQRALHHLGESSSNNHHDEPSESSHHDPLHITASGLDPLNARASATCMSRKFFLTPPERLQVDQSVNLMDVETGHYDADTKDHQRRSNGHNNGSLFSGFMASYTQQTTSSPQSSVSQLLSSSLPTFNKSSSPEPRQSVASQSGRRDSMQSVQLNNQSEASKHNANTTLDSLTSHSERKSQHIGFIEAFLDEELGVSEDSKTRSKSKKKKKKKKRKLLRRATTSDKKKVDFPQGYNPNEWEFRASTSKSATPLLPQTTDDITTEDSATVAHANRQPLKTTKRSKKGKSKRRRLRPGRVALLLTTLFVIIAIILLILIFTGEILWHQWHPAQPEDNDSPPLPLLERNHSFLDVHALPTSTQFLLHEDQSPQQKALQWLQDDPKTTVLADQVPNFLTTTTSSMTSPLDGLAALQKFVLTTLYYSTSDDQSWPEPWMDAALNECDWFSGHHNDGDYSVCNRYHQLHALLFQGHHLEGRLPTEELTLLPNLKHVDFAHNSLKGIVPGVWFQTWRNLEYFTVENNRMTGQLPTELGLLTNSNGLRELNFNSNQFTGTLPSELGALMLHLDVLEVAHNQLTGSLPPQLGGSDYRALERLRLNDNDFSGLIPSELGLLTQLTDLQLHHNIRLQVQDLPREICDLPLLKTLTVDCQIITCADDCGCTCVDPVPTDAPEAVEVAKQAAKEVAEEAATAVPSAANVFARDDIPDIPEGEFMHAETTVLSRGGAAAANPPKTPAPHVAGNVFGHSSIGDSEETADDETIVVYKGGHFVKSKVPRKTLMPADQAEQCQCSCTVQGKPWEHGVKIIFTEKFAIAEHGLFYCANQKKAVKGVREGIAKCDKTCLVEPAQNIFDGGSRRFLRLGRDAL